MASKNAAKPRPCSLCERPHWANGYCSMHNKRFKRTGTPAVNMRGQHRNLAGKRGAEHPTYKAAPLWPYQAAHDRVRSVRGAASEQTCSCGAPARDWAFDEPTGYSFDVGRYRPLCRSCHLRADRLVA